jgi:hypothetical protein
VNRPAISIYSRLFRKKLREREFLEGMLNEFFKSDLWTSRMLEMMEQSPKYRTKFWIGGAGLDELLDELDQIQHALNVATKKLVALKVLPVYMKETFIDQNPERFQSDRKDKHPNDQNED